jgi:hypothetical protein
MAFAQLTFANRTDKFPVYINPDHVVAFYTSGASGTLIFTAGPDKAQEILVAEPVDAVVRLLKSAQ